MSYDDIDSPIESSEEVLEIEGVLEEDLPLDEEEEDLPLDEEDEEADYFSEE